MAVSDLRLAVDDLIALNIKQGSHMRRVFRVVGLGSGVVKGVRSVGVGAIEVDRVRGVGQGLCVGGG